jgi:hypothetical protein
VHSLVLQPVHYAKVLYLVAPSTSLLVASQATAASRLLSQSSFTEIKQASISRDLGAAAAEHQNTQLPWPGSHTSSWNCSQGEHKQQNSLEHAVDYLPQVQECSWSSSTSLAGQNGFPSKDCVLTVSCIEYITTSYSLHAAWLRIVIVSPPAAVTRGGCCLRVDSHCRPASVFHLINKTVASIWGGS